MINILLPSMGTSVFFKDSYFPKPLVEINGQTMLEMVVDNYSVFEEKTMFLFFSMGTVRSSI